MRYKLNSKVIQRMGKKFLNIYNAENGVSSFLDTIAIDIWKYLIQGLNLHQILDKFCTSYPDVDSELIKSDIYKIVSNLANSRIIIKEDNQTINDTEITSDFKICAENKKLNNNYLSAKRNINKASLMLTNQCNFRCMHCYIPDSWRETKEMTTAQWKEVIQDLKELGCLNILVTGGEPLLRPDLMEILRYIDQEQFVIELNTNASLLTEEFVRKLKDLKYLKSVNISLYGLRDSTLQTVTQNHVSIKTIFDKIKLLQTYNVDFFLRFVPLKVNYNDLEFINEFVEKTGVKPEVDLGLILPKLDLDLDSTNYNLEKTQMIGLLENGLATVKQGKLTFCNSSLRCAIGASGNVSICELLMGQSHGNVLQNSLKDIWTGESFGLFLETFEINSQCANCDLQRYCIRCNGCAYLETKDWAGISPSACKIAMWTAEFMNSVGAK